MSDIKGDDRNGVKAGWLGKWKGKPWGETKAQEFRYLNRELVIRYLYPRILKDLAHETTSQAIKDLNYPSHLFKLLPCDWRVTNRTFVLKAR